MKRGTTRHDYLTNIINNYNKHKIDQRIYITNYSKFDLLALQEYLKEIEFIKFTLEELESIQIDLNNLFVYNLLDSPRNYLDFKIQLYSNSKIYLYGNHSYIKASEKNSEYVKYKSLKENITVYQMFLLLLKDQEKQYNEDIKFLTEELNGKR
jgi:hypothetical protein